MTVRRNIPWRYRMAAEFTSAQKYGLACFSILIAPGIGQIAVLCDAGKFAALILTFGLMIPGAGYILGWWGR